MKRFSLISFLSTQGVLIALAALILFGWLRYDNFLGLFNISTVLRYNSMFALVALGMCFVIMTGGIDLSVGATAAFGSVVSALLSPYGILVGTAGGVAASIIASVAINGRMRSFTIMRPLRMPIARPAATPPAVPTKMP